MPASGSPVLAIGFNCIDFTAPVWLLLSTAVIRFQKKKVANAKLNAVTIATQKATEASMVATDGDGGDGDGDGFAVLVVTGIDTPLI